MTRQVGYLLGLVVSVCGAVLGQAELLGEPWRHYVTIAFVITTAVSGYLMQKPSPWDGIDRRN